MGELLLLSNLDSITCDKFCANFLVALNRFQGEGSRSSNIMLENHTLSDDYVRA